MQARLINELSLVGKRMRSASQLTVLAICWLAFFLIAWSLSNGEPLLGLSPAISSLVFLGGCLIFTVVFCLISRNWFSDLRWVAARVESRYPELDSRLLTALDQLAEDQRNDVGFLQHIVITQTVSHSNHNPWTFVVSPSKLIFAQLAAFLGFILVLIGSIMIASGDPLAQTETARPIGTPLIEVERDATIELVSVEPGNTAIEKGTTLTVLAKFKQAIPENAELVYEFANSAGAAEGFHRIQMNASFDDPIFAGQIEELTKPITYWVEFGDEASDRFYATVFEYPELQQLDFELDFPAYTGLANKVINDGRRISALKGTRVIATARLNKTVSAIELNSSTHPSISFTADPSGEPVYRAEFVVEQTAQFELNLTDEADRSNKLPPEVQINALVNQPPTIKILSPGRDVEVSPIEELMTVAEISDDYGIEKVGLTFGVAGQDPQELELRSKLPAKNKHQVDHLLEFEKMKVSPKQVVSYFFWVEDRVADNQTRRVMSDMFFAEVRDFDKIFRQGAAQTRQQQQQQQQQQGNQQQQQQMGELRQLQKEIINATWKLIRRETDAETSQNFADDVGVIQDSQHTASQLVDRALERVTSPDAKAVGTQIKDMMNKVVLTLQSAKDQDSAKPLIDAVSKEQLVYQMILQLASDESQVQQQQQSSSSSSSSQQSRSRQQLQQLQLSNDQNRYEQENQAQQQNQQEQSEVRQALNRLKELARRQEDINKQLEQLQTALEEAKSEEEKKEIERRLKRLREQQQELLRDLDELKDQAEQNRDNQLMNQASEELDKARENVRRSAEALKENQVSQAAAAGNRAQKQFEDLKEEFRKQNANQFADQMKEMRDKANDLKSKQDEIAKRLEDMDQQSKKSLRENEDRSQLAEDLINQRKKYDSVLEDIKDVVKNAEESEPLLSQQLYDTFRDTSRSPTRDAINNTEDLLSRGFITEARRTETEANEGIEKLNEGIQKAADSIIGDEAQSLRRAEQTLRKLSDQINSEIEQNEPGQSSQQDAKDSNSKSSPNQADASANRKSDPANSSKSDPSGKQTPGNRSTKGQSGQKQSDDKGAAQPRQQNGDSKSKSGQSKSGNPAGDSKQNPSQNPSKNDPNSKGSQGNRQNNPKQSNSQQGKASPGQSKQGGSKQGSPKQGSPKQGGSKQGGSKQGGSKQSGSSAGNQDQNSNPSQNPRSNQGNQRPSGKNSPNRNQASRNPFDGYENLFGPSNGGAPRPITGTEYRQFSNDLREIEELLEDPKLRAKAAEIREKAKEIRVEMKRHSKQPNWDVVQEFIAEPLETLRAEVARQLLLKENKEALVPIDRDPVPTIFEEQVREYYKELSEVEK